MELVDVQWIVCGHNPKYPEVRHRRCLWLVENGVLGGIESFDGAKDSKTWISETVYFFCKMNAREERHLQRERRYNGDGMGSQGDQTRGYCTWAGPYKNNGCALQVKTAAVNGAKNSDMPKCSREFDLDGWSRSKNAFTLASNKNNGWDHHH